MKILRLILLITLVVSFMPLDAFCDDHDQAEEHHHGVLVCHSSCYGAVLTNAQSLNLPEISTHFISVSDFSYDEPILPAEFRPPITVS